MAQVWLASYPLSASMGLSYKWDIQTLGRIVACGYQTLRCMEEEGSGAETGVQYPCADRSVASPVGNKPTPPSVTWTN